MLSVAKRATNEKHIHKRKNEQGNSYHLHSNPSVMQSRQPLSDEKKKICVIFTSD
jgi:hypothetical protein